MTGLVRHRHLATPRLLEAAADVLEARGLCRFSFMELNGREDGEIPGGAVCTVGAMAVAAAGDSGDPDRYLLRLHRVGLGALPDVVRAAIENAMSAVETTLAVADPEGRIGGVLSWSDVEGRTAAEAAAMLRRAARRSTVT